MKYKHALLRCITPRRLGLVLCFLGFIWAMVLMNLSLIGRQDDTGNPEALRASTVEPCC